MAQFRADRTATAFAVCLLVCACGTDRLHESAVDFSQAAAATLDAETAIADRTNALAAAEKRSRARLWYLDNPGHPSPSLSRPASWTPDQLPQGGGPVSAGALADRVACLQAVQSYAQVIEAVTSGANTASIDAATTALFGSLSAAVKAGGGTLSPGAQGIAATAVDELGRVVVNVLTTRKVVAAAQAARKPLGDIAAALSSEAVMLSQNQQSALQSLANAQGDVLSRIWHDRSVSTEGRLGAWERVMEERNVQDVPVTEARINHALDALVQANDALATGDHPGFGVLATQALAEARHAIATYQSASK